MTSIAKDYHTQRHILPSAYVEAMSGEALYEPMKGMHGVYAEHILQQGEDVYFAAKSKTCIDVGGWMGHAPIWALALKDSLCLIACGRFFVGPKPYVQRILYSELQTSTYNHIVGAVALAPVSDLPAHGLKMSPANGYQLLAQIFYKGE